jgi:hypothetical protein
MSLSKFRWTLGLLALTLAVASGAAPAGGRDGYPAPSRARASASSQRKLERVVISLVNSERHGHGRTRVALSVRLRAIANDAPVSPGAAASRIPATT